MQTHIESNRLSLMIAMNKQNFSKIFMVSKHAKMRTRRYLNGVAMYLESVCMGTPSIRTISKHHFHIMLILSRVTFIRAN
jgi:hypothetical protein